jgi:peptide/nickel transport system substrate-binding protein
VFRMNSRRRGLIAVTSGVALVALLTGCVQSDRTADDGAAADAEVDSTFVFAASSDPVSLDPAFASDGESFRVARQIFEGLVGVEAGSADPAPALAESWEQSEDGLSYDFALKEGVTFHDGTDFDAEAVCYNFDRWYNFTGVAASEATSYYYGALFRAYAEAPEGAVYASCTPGDSPTEVTVTLAQPFAGFIAALSLPAFSMQSPTALAEYNADDMGGTAEAPALTEYGQAHPVGTGPFSFKSWEVGAQVELTAYPDYWGEQGDVQEIIFRVIDDPQARRQSLEAGTIDGYDLVSPADTEALAADGFQIVPRDPFTILYLGLNQQIPELQDVRVRQAITMAIDKQQLIDQTLPEGTELATQFIPPVVAGYNEDVTTYDYDPEAAKDLLAEAGYPDGFSIKFNYPTGVSRPYMPTPEEVFTNISAQLEEVGITVEPQPNAWSPDYLDRIRSGADHGLHLLGWTGDYNDTDNFVGVFFGAESNEFGFNDPDLFDALSEARGVSSVEEQTPLYEDINEQVALLIPAVPLAHPAPSLAFGERVTSYPASPVSDEPFNLIELSS